MEGLQKQNEDNGDQEKDPNKPNTLPGLLNVLIEKGTLADFAQEADQLKLTITDPGELKIGLEKLVEKYTQ